MSKIDPTARVEDGAVIGEGTEIGPFCIIGPHVVIGKNCKLIGHVHITAQTTIGDDCTIYPFASLGTPPQSLSYRGELTRLEYVKAISRSGELIAIGEARLPLLYHPILVL